MATIDVHQRPPGAPSNPHLLETPREHRALDHAAALKIEIHRLRRGLRRGRPVGEDQLAHLERLVDRLAGLLSEAPGRGADGS